MVHNPSAIMSILGRCPAPELIEVGITVCLGSDAGAPDRGFDMFRQIAQAMRAPLGMGLKGRTGSFQTYDPRLDVAGPACGTVVQTWAVGLDVVLVVDGPAGARAVDIFLEIAAADYFLATVGDRCPAVRR